MWSELLVGSITTVGGVIIDKAWDRRNERRKKDSRQEADSESARNNVSGSVNSGNNSGNVYTDSRSWTKNKVVINSDYSNLTQAAAAGPSVQPRDRQSFDAGHVFLTIFCAAIVIYLYARNQDFILRWLVYGYIAILGLSLGMLANALHSRVKLNNRLGFYVALSFSSIALLFTSPHLAKHPAWGNRATNWVSTVLKYGVIETYKQDSSLIAFALVQILGIILAVAAMREIIQFNRALLWNCRAATLEPNAPKLAKYSMKLASYRGFGRNSLRIFLSAALAIFCISGAAWSLGKRGSDKFNSEILEIRGSYNARNNLICVSASSDIDKKMNTTTEVRVFLEQQDFKSGKWARINGFEATADAKLRCQPTSLRKGTAVRWHELGGLHHSNTITLN